MAIVNTGMHRATELTVTKKIGDNNATGYPKVYRLGDAFSNYIALSDTELAKISVDEYQSRLTAFKVYVERIEIGLVVNTEGTYVENLVSCPITA